MDKSDTQVIEDYLRLVQAGDLSTFEICELIGITPARLQLTLSLTKNKPVIEEIRRKIGLTAIDFWRSVDSWIEKGMSDFEICSFFNLTEQQVAWRRHFKMKHMV